MMQVVMADISAIIYLHIQQTQTKISIHQSCVSIRLLA